MNYTGIKALSGKAKWIWLKQGNGLNQFAEFVKTFTAPKGKKATLLLSGLTQNVVYVNGKFVHNGQYADFPFYKVYDTVDITDYLVDGQNVLSVLCYNQGDNSYPYLYKTPAFTFSIEVDGQVVAYSDADTLVRLSKTYRSGKAFTLAPPVGYTLHCDLTGEDGFIDGKGADYENAVLVEVDYPLFPRPTKYPEIIDDDKSLIRAQGVFKDGGGDTIGKRAQYAFLSSRTLVDMTGVVREECDTLPNEFKFDGKGAGDGVYVVIDMYKERAGYLTFDLEVDNDAEVIIAMGEHLADMRVRAFVGGRNFAMGFTLKKGRNVFTEYVRRIAGRYLMLYVYTNKVTVRKLTVLDYMYPLTETPAVLPDPLKQRIYDVGLRTLKLCIHEHYEDCPGREQSLYGQDSRNQMLFGYGCFEGTEMQRECLRLFAIGGKIKKDGLVGASTVPGDALDNLPGFSKTEEEMGIGGIPNFALCWVLAVCEYYEHTKDAEFIKEVFPEMKRVMDAYEDKIRDIGIECFPHANYFNFYEWSKGMEPDTNANTDVMKILRTKASTIDCIPTAHFAFIVGKLSEVLTDMKWGDSQKYAKLHDLVSPLVENFYDETDGYYFSYIDKDGNRYGKHECTQAHVLFCEAGDKSHHARVARQMIKSRDNGLGRITISTYQYKFEGVIKALGEEGLQWVYSELENVFGEMCFEGYTSFPEMEGGEKIFEDAASLCHGWAGIGCYIYNKYLLKKPCQTR